MKLLKSGTGIEFKSMMAGTVSLGPSTKPDIKQCVYLKYQLDEWMDELVGSSCSQRDSQESSPTP